VLKKQTLLFTLKSWRRGRLSERSGIRLNRALIDPFVLVVEGSIPNEKIKSEGYWAALGSDRLTEQPITTNEWIDRLAPKAAALVAIGPCATYGGIHAMSGNPTGAMGLADYLGWPGNRKLAFRWR